MTSLWNHFLNITLRGPEKIAAYLQWLAPLVARLVVGEVFMTAGWGKLQNMDAMIENFTRWGIPFPQILTPFTSGAECVCGILLMLGLFTRISAGILGVIMIVAIQSVLWVDVDSLDTLLGFSETAYLVIFFWLAIAGGGKIAIDHYLCRSSVNAKII